MLETCQTKNILTRRKFETETSLYFYRARYYDPGTGRFTSEDPFGLDGGIDFYTYVRNASTTFTDPLGLYDTEPEVPKPRNCPEHS